ncbi:hypothetical protein FE075_04695 [Salmonella enterica]|nr:hypothetical protein [Salmonella enterica]
MTTQISVETLSPITHNQIPVITTELLAHLYGTKIKNISDNFLNNTTRFVVGKHFFKIEKNELREFKNRPETIGLVGKNARSLILWTERGAARHAKMLETDQAWEVFEKLEDCYFSQTLPSPTRQVQPAVDMLNIDLLIKIRDGIADVAGTAGNTDDGTALRLGTPITGIPSTGYADTLIGGADKEELETWRARVMERYYWIPQGGADPDYVIWAKEIAGITRAWTFRHYKGIRVYISTRLGVIAAAENLQAGSAIFNKNGDVYGDIWGGGSGPGWLSAFVASKPARQYITMVGVYQNDKTKPFMLHDDGSGVFLATTDMLSGYVQSIRFGAVEHGNLYRSPGFADQLGYVITGVENGDSNDTPDRIQRRLLQLKVNGQWYTVGA